MYGFVCVGLRKGTVFVCFTFDFDYGLRACFWLWLACMFLNTFSYVCLNQVLGFSVKGNAQQPYLSVFISQFPFSVDRWKSCRMLLCLKKSIPWWQQSTELPRVSHCEQKERTMVSHCQMKDGSVTYHLQTENWKKDLVVNHCKLKGLYQLSVNWMKGGHQ